LYNYAVNGIRGKKCFEFLLLSLKYFLFPKYLYISINIVFQFLKYERFGEFFMLKIHFSKVFDMKIFEAVERIQFYSKKEK
jgi:hypothetical protein